MTIQHLTDRPTWREGEPCNHPGCLSHISHPCEGCGRIGGRSALPTPSPTMTAEDARQIEVIADATDGQLSARNRRVAATYRALSDAQARIRELEHASTYLHEILGVEAARRAENMRLTAALEEIAEGRGPFSRDPLTHAGNCIDAMTKLATDALARPTTEETNDA